MSGQGPTEVPADPIDSSNRPCHSRSHSFAFSGESDMHALETTLRNAVDPCEGAFASPSRPMAPLPLSPLFTSPLADSFGAKLLDLDLPAFPCPARIEADTSVAEFDRTAVSPRWPPIPLPPCEDGEPADPGAPPPWPLPAFPGPLTLSLSALADDNDDALSSASVGCEPEAQIWEAASLLLIPRARRRAMSAPLRPGVVWDTRERGRAVGFVGEE